MGLWHLRRRVRPWRDAPDGDGPIARWGARVHHANLRHGEVEEPLDDEGARAPLHCRGGEVMAIGSLPHDAEEEREQADEYFVGRGFDENERTAEDRREQQDMQQAGRQQAIAGVGFDGGKFRNRAQ